MTFRTKLLSFAAVVGAVVSIGALAAQAQSQTIEWRVVDRHETAGVDFNLSYRHATGTTNIGRTTPLSQLRGLSQAQLDAGAAQIVRFSVVRDAGTFACEGSAQRQNGSGICDFQPGRAFAQRLAAAGSGQADDGQLLQLAMMDVGGPYLDELRRQRYATPSVGELVRAAQHGVNLPYLQGMGAAGYGFTQLGMLSDLHDHGVNPRYIQGLKDAGYTGLPAAQIQRLRDHGVSTEFIAQMAAAGYRKLAPEDLVRLRDHGVSASFVAQLAEIGYRNVPTEDLVRLRDHGVSISYIRRANAEGGPLNTDDLIRMRDRGER